MRRGWNLRWMLFGTVAVTLLVCAGVAYALTSADFEPRASEWQGSTCNEGLLTAKASAATNQKIATCFAVAKVKEQQSTIASLQASVGKLEATQTAPPLDFTFFNAVQTVKGAIVSPVVDASKYKTITVTASGGATFVLEVSNDQTSWLTARTLANPPVSEAVPVSGHYYRMTANPGAGASTVNAVGHLTN